MSIFRYQASPVVDEITFRKSDGGTRRAYLHAKPDITPDQLVSVSNDLNAKGFQCIPTRVKGQPMLEVRGFGKEDDITTLGSSHGWLQGPCEETREKSDKVSFTDKIRKRSFQAAGLSFLVGDAAFTKYGWKGGSPLDTAGGLAYSAGTITSLLFGRKDPADLTIKDISKRMAEHMRQQHLQLAPGTALSTVSADENKGIVKRTDEFLRHYPTELMNSFYAMAGVCIALAAYRGQVKGKVNIETFIETAERLGTALNGQMSRVKELTGLVREKKIPLKDLSAEAATKFEELLKEKLGLLERGITLSHADIDHIEKFAGEQSQLRHATRTLNIKTKGSDLIKIQKELEDDFAEKIKLEGKNAVNPVLLGKAKDRLGQLSAEMKSEVTPDIGGDHLHKLVAADIRRHKTHEGWLDMGLGGMTLASGMFGTLVQEKPIDPDKPQPTGLGAAWAQMRAHPLSVTAAGYMVSTLCHAVSTGIAIQHGDAERRRTVGYRAIFVGTNILAEILIAISSKGHGHGVHSDQSIPDSVMAIAAESIAQQPTNMQNPLIDYISKFIGRDDVLGLKDSEVADRLRHEVEAMRGNPWAMANNLKKPALTPASPQHAPSNDTPQVAAWQAKIAQQAAAQRPAGPQAAV